MPPTYLNSMAHDTRKLCLMELAHRTEKADSGTSSGIEVHSRVAAAMLKKPETLVLPYVEVLLTSKCSLKCRYCANLMQYYRPGQHLHFDAETVERSIDKLLESMDFLHQLRFIGGEPLLYRELPRLMRHALGKRNVGFVQIVTNGTVFPRKELLDVLRHPRASVSLSDYGEQSSKLEPIMAQLERRGIIYAKHRPKWQNNGPLQLRGFSEAKMRHVYGTCSDLCKTLLGDELHVCPRSAHGIALGAIPRRGDEYVSLFAQDVSETRAKIRMLYDLRTLTACGYCTPVEERRDIPAAEQMPRDEYPDP